ncbi:spore germination protein KA [Paenibacillus sophorae]|uniref:Spore germination protein n=1 Tax=Paenibacillus sophorae TaxID=1333845 RepID=A0A1H8RW52_9BACL|nr:spore germination protein [Paenibacillus sophorae]QWU16964.1 spore germination protein [Paenibacillus sophorae]SEO70173.1 spore germination protein KA [Paenibacillus sophorae]
MMIWRRKRLSSSTPAMDDPVATEETLSAEISQNEAFVKQAFQRCSDLVIRKINHLDGTLRQIIVYLETLADDKKVSEQLVKPLTADQHNRRAVETETWEGESMPVDKKVVTSRWSEIIRLVLRGHAAVFTEGEDHAVCFAVNAIIQRSIEEPSSEQVIRGGKEGFIERQSVNVGLLRNYLRTPRLKMEAYSVGELTETKVLVAYIEGLADDTVIDQVRNKIASIQIDGVLESGTIEELIVDDPFPIFPHVQITERPDVVAGSLLEGRVAILVDNTPFVMIVPTTFWAGLQASEDYYLNSPVATFTRWVRFIFLFVAIFAPSFFVAVTSYHQEMIPTSLLLSIASAREPVPFPVMIEALIMEIMFEALREAGIRLPRAIGQTVSIVGGLVIGQAAVLAGIISAPILIVVSTTGIAAFLIPRFNFANGVRLLRFPIILLAGSLGLYGMALGFLGILLYVVHLKSFGVPYFTPVAPFSLRAFKDVWIRAPRNNGGGLSGPSYERAVKAPRQEGGE